MRVDPINIAWSFVLTNTRGHVEFSYREFASHMSTAGMSHRDIMTPHYYLCSTAVLATWGRHQRRFPQLRFYEYPECLNTELGIRDLPLHVTVEAVIWEKEVKCACRRGWEWHNQTIETVKREREMCLQHKICQVTFYITADFFFKSQFCTTATKLRPWYFRRKAIILIFWEPCPAVIAIISLNWFSCRFSCVTHNYWQSRLLSTRPHRCSRFFAKFGRWHNDECASFWHHAYAYHFKAKAKLELH